MELTASGKVILGMLGIAPMSGYDIKAAVDGSTRFFWAISYGQIYPELRKLAERGLIESTEAAGGGRGRTVYELTAAGREALREWLLDPADMVELRHESLLALFFSDVLDPAERVEGMRRLGRRERARMEALQQLSPEVPTTGEAIEESSNPGITLEFGIEFYGFLADWWERRADRLERELASAEDG